MIKSLYLLPLGFLFIGCSTYNQTIDIKEKPILQVPKKPDPIVRKKGSLYTRKGPSLFSDKKDLQVGDIIKVFIFEKLDNTSIDTMESSKASSTGIGGGLVTNRSPGNTAIDNLTKKTNHLLGLGFNANSSNSLSGSVEAKSNEEFATEISAVITQTYQNGNYFIEGSKQMLINGQKQIIKISGLIRPYDITPENTINSSQLANLKILYNKAGKEMQSVDKPWGSDLIENVAPF